MRRIALLLLLLPVLAAQPVRATDDVVIYRCTGREGRLTFRDTPCTKDQVQQVRTMQRPRDAPTPVAAAPSPAQQAPVAEPAPIRVVVVREPRPLYECVPPEGDPYTSDSPEGRPRWVPLWTLGLPYAGLSLRASPLIGSDVGQARPRPGGYGLAGYGAGAWIRDTCRALPQADVCARLVDRRDEIRRRFFNAMPSERETLGREDRAVTARLDNDCGAQ